MKKTLRAIRMGVLLAGLMAVIGQAADVETIRTTNGPEQMRMVLELNELPKDWQFHYDKETREMRLRLVDTVNRNTRRLPKKEDKGLLEAVSIEQSGTDLLLRLKMKEPVKHQLNTMGKPTRMILDAYPVRKEATSSVSRKLGNGVVWNRVAKHTTRGLVQYEMGTIPVRTEVGLVLADRRPMTVAAAAKAARATWAINGPAGSLPAYYIHGTWTPGETGTGVLVYRGQNHGFNIVPYEKGMEQRQVIIGKTSYTVAGINRARHADEVILYDARYGSSTKTNRYGTELTIRGGQVTAVNQTGDTKIPHDGMIVSAHGRYEDILAKVPIGTKVTISKSMLANDTVFAVAGGDLILHQGKLLVDQKADEDMAPRTVLGTKKDGTLVALVADGYQAQSRGLTRYECAQLLQAAGATEAMIWADKGGATWYVDGAVTNQPQPVDSRGKQFHVVLVAYS